MKTALIFVAIIATGLAVPQPRKMFHEHVEDFLDIILQEAGHDLEHLLEHYLEFEEFTAALDFLRANTFKTLVHEIEDLPEFKAAVDFLENNKIDITYFLDILEQMFDRVNSLKRQSRHTLSGRDFPAFIKDCISEFPKTKLAALFDQKFEENEEFRSAIENLNTDEWVSLYNALWENETFREKSQNLKDNGIDLEVLLLEVRAVFGQN